jgi:acetyl esterase/lipase
MPRARVLVLAAVIIVAGAGCEIGNPTADQFLKNATPTHANVVVQSRTCQYADPNGPQSMAVTVYLPDPAKRTVHPSPAAVYLHGGGWYSGSPATIDGPVPGFPDRPGGAILAQLDQGWVVTVADYRLSGTVAFPGPLTDAKAAVNCTKAIGDVDGNHVVVSGSSAGGTLALLTGLAPGWEPTSVATVTDLSGSAPSGTTSVHAIVDLDGPTNLHYLTDAPFGGNPDPGLDKDFGGGVTFRQLVPWLLCGPGYNLTTSTCPTPQTHTVDDASPIHYVPTTFAGNVSPHIYLACGDTSAVGFPRSFDTSPDPAQPSVLRCNDAWAFYQQLLVAYGSDGSVANSAAANVAYDSTFDNTANPERLGSGGDHFSIDTHLHFAALQQFLAL